MDISLTKKTIGGGALVVLGVLLGGSVHAAYLSLEPSEGRYYANENFAVSVVVNAETAINAVQGTLTFPTAYLEAVQVNRSNINSIIDLWVERPSFSNAGETGNVRFEGVALNPGFAGSAGKVIEVIFRVKREGSAALQFGEFAILANDGLGTNVAAPGAGAAFSLLPPRALPSEEQKGGAEREAIEAVEEKIKSVEERIGFIERPVAPRSGVFQIWEVLPEWVKISVLALVGVTAVILSLIVLGFGIVVLVWIWSYGWHRRARIARWAERVPRAFRWFAREAFSETEAVGAEIESDIRYSVRELKHDVREAEGDVPFAKLLRDYWGSVVKIVRRFFTWNKR